MLKRRYVTVDGSRHLVRQVDGFDGYEIHWTSPCSGCHEGYESGCSYEWSERNKCEKGAGCFECGYTGLRVRSHWVPVDANAFQEYLDRDRVRERGLK